MKKSILNIAAVAVIAASAFVACNKGQGTNDAATQDSANVVQDTVNAQPEVQAQDTVNAKAETPQTEAPQAEATAEVAK